METYIVEDVGGFGPCVVDRFTGEIVAEFDFPEEAEGMAEWLNMPDSRQAQIEVNLLLMFH